MLLVYFFIMNVSLIKSLDILLITSISFVFPQCFLLCQTQAALFCLQEKRIESCSKGFSSFYMQSYKYIFVPFFPVTLFHTKNYDFFSVTIFPTFMKLASFVLLLDLLSVEPFNYEEFKFYRLGKRLSSIGKNMK